MTVEPVRFSTVLARTGANTTGIVVPPEIIAQLGAGARPKLVVRVDDYTYRTTVGVMGGRAMLPFSAEHRSASGLSGGDAIAVEVALDTASREVEIPPDLAAALAAAAAASALAAFAKQAPSRRKADIDLVLGAKSDETRARRIAAIIARLGG